MGRYEVGRISKRKGKKEKRYDVKNYTVNDKVSERRIDRQTWKTSKCKKT